MKWTLSVSSAVNVLDQLESLVELVQAILVTV